MIPTVRHARPGVLMREIVLLLLLLMLMLLLRLRRHDDYDRRSSGLAVVDAAAGWDWIVTDDGRSAIGMRRDGRRGGSRRRRTLRDGGG